MHSFFTMLKLSALFVLSTLCSLAASYPNHASCEVKWRVNVDCQQVQQLLVQKIEDWSQDNCPGTSQSCPKLPCGQRCKYKLVSQESNRILAEHRTPAKDYLDNLEFQLEADANDNNSCLIEGKSSSSLSFAYLDFGTNYCNLWNLMDGAGLVTDDDGFSEESSTRVCTQYDKINCDRY